MPINFKMVAKQNNLATPPETKYYPVAIAKSEMGLDDLAQIVASGSTLSIADCYGVMIAMSEVIGKALTDGKRVKIERIGTFSVGLQGTASDTPDVLGKANIKKAKINFLAAARLKQKINEADFKRIR